jgi:hypothetical protein
MSHLAFRIFIIGIFPLCQAVLQIPTPLHTFARKMAHITSARHKKKGQAMRPA